MLCVVRACSNQKHYEWCGSSYYGSGCIQSPPRKRWHVAGANKYIWFGTDPDVAR